ncbi:GAF and ANTAR domain-containing protein [Saccharomonospora sp. NPDC046836]|uniref:GAF and ANTAR domain-containing protein n=1 Tax=Saccharomonospora sp. NPDC046836 TaxID=3156921 RepID=UPI0033E982DA
MRTGQLSAASIASAMIALVDTAVSDVDVARYAEKLTARCLDLLGVQAAALLLAYPEPPLRPVAASSDEARAVLDLHAEDTDGPAMDCFTKGVAVTVPDLAAETHRTPALAAATQAGYAAWHTLPVRLREEMIGTLSLFSTDRGPLPTAVQGVGQALVDAAAVGLAHRRELTRSSALAQQLQTALDTRIVIEQAKGILAAQQDCTVDEAFQRLRRHARNTNQRIHDLAHDIVAGKPGQTVPHGPRHHRA